ALTLVDRLPPDFAALAAQLHLPGRCQHLTVQGVDWYLDVGHNREALARFRSRLPSPAGRRLALCAMLADKPAAAVLQDFSPAVDVWYLAGLAGSRGRTAQELAQCLPVQRTACCHAQVEQAVKAVLAVQQPGDQVLVFGSFHT